MKATIKDVARVSGLSVGTISKYINGFDVKAENKAKIEKTLKELNYVRDNRARGLRTDKSYTLGIVWDLPGNQYESNVIEKLEQELRKRQYLVIISFHRNDIALAGDIFKSMEERRVDGIIVKPIEGMQRILKRLGDIGIPVVEAESAYPFGMNDRIVSGMMHGIYMSGAYLIEHGHKQIALLGAGKKTDYLTKDRRKGYLRVLEDYEIDVRREYMPEFGIDFASGYQGMEYLWSLEIKPTGVIFASYNVCLGAMSYLHKQKVDIPGDLSVIVYDDLEFSMISNPKLCAISRPVEDFVHKLTDILFRRIDRDISDFPMNIKLVPTLIRRESVRKIGENKTDEKYRTKVV